MGWDIGTKEQLKGLDDWEGGEKNLGGNVADAPRERAEKTSVGALQPEGFR